MLLFFDKPANASVYFSDESPQLNHELSSMKNCAFNSCGGPEGVAKAVTVVFRMTKSSRSTLSAVIEVRAANVSYLCRADRAFSLQRECSTGKSLIRAILLRRREMCANSATAGHTWYDEV
jgi:hypothetical protein